LILGTFLIAAVSILSKAVPRDKQTRASGIRPESPCKESNRPRGVDDLCLGCSKRPEPARLAEQLRYRILSHGIDSFWW
jgi:hypothetical protein